MATKESFKEGDYVTLKKECDENNNDERGLCNFSIGQIETIHPDGGLVIRVACDRPIRTYEYKPEEVTHFVVEVYDHDEEVGFYVGEVVDDEERYDVIGIKNIDTEEEHYYHMDYFWDGTITIIKDPANYLEHMRRRKRHYESLPTLTSMQLASKQGTLEHLPINPNTQGKVMSYLSGYNVGTAKEKNHLKLLQEFLTRESHENLGAGANARYGKALNKGPLPHGPTENNFVGGARHRNFNNYNNRNRWYEEVERHREWEEARRENRIRRGLDPNNNSNNNNNNWVNPNDEWQAMQNMEEWRQQLANARAAQWGYNEFNNENHNLSEENRENRQALREAAAQEGTLREVSTRGTLEHLPIDQNVQRVIHSMITGVPPAVGPSGQPSDTQTIESAGMKYLQEVLTRRRGAPGAGIPPLPKPTGFNLALRNKPLPYGPTEENFMGGKRRKSLRKIGNKMARRGTRRSRGIFSRLYAPIGHLLSAGKESVGAVTNTAKGVVGEGIHGLDKIGRSVTKHANMAVKDVFTRKRRGGGKRKARGTRKSRKSRRNTRRRR